MANNIWVAYLFVALMLVTSITLLATKHHFVSLTISTAAVIIVILALVPSDRNVDMVNSKWEYVANGGARLVPKKAKSETENKPAKGEKVKPHMRANLSNNYLGTSTSLPPSYQPPTINDGQSGLPKCNNPPVPTDSDMRNYIRNNGLYGIHGNLSCQKMQRSSVADKGILQPLQARDQLLQFLASDQLHAKDPQLIPRFKQTIA